MSQFVRSQISDSVGNTTAAMGKGFAIGSAALTALALFVSYANAVNLDAINILAPRVTIGIFIGGMLTFLFSAFTMESVSKAAYKMIEEVRRQFREKPGIMKGLRNRITNHALRSPQQQLFTR